jgi:outer membrane lipoprotein LolB
MLRASRAAGVLRAPPGQLLPDLWHLTWIVCVGLSGCAAWRGPDAVPDPIQAWELHQQRVGALRNWVAYGRIALRAEEEAWNITMHWRQQGERYQIRFSGPLGQGAMELSGDGTRVTLRTASNEVRSAPDPETLLFDTVGWRVPLRGLHYWIRGLATDPAAVSSLDLDPAGRLKRLSQDGWRVQFLRYAAVDDLELPTKVSLENSKVSARIVVKRWILGS